MSHHLKMKPYGFEQSRCPDADETTVWGQTGTSTKVTCGPLGTLDADAPKAAKKLAKVFPAYMAEKLGHNRPESVYRREECSIAWMA